ncbi:MAG: gfo/Idh/MocA family oxidoreductase [Candidatus Latescibacteria bacterium]|nr:gfo/Idh/MocA family oxidoreductase [Candidatus Latescibacterota bacterium]
MPQIRTALIGCGKIGRTHAQALGQLPESDFVAVCDTQSERAESFAAEFNSAPYTDVATMVRQSQVQAVFVATPHPLHTEAVLAAVGHGAHALVEKPLAASLADCDRMIAAAQQAGVHLGTISQRRLYEPAQRLKAAIDAGKIGRPVLGVLQMFNWRDQAYYESDPWRGRWDSEGGGVLVNQAPHQLDLLQWYMGPIQEVSAYWGNLNHPYIEVEDTAVAVIRFRNGGLGSLVVSNSQKPGIYSKIHIHGDNGASVGVQTDGGATFIAGVSEVVEPPITDLWSVPGEEDLLPQFQAADRAAFAAVDPAAHYHLLQIDDFLQAVLQDRPPLVPGQEGRNVVEFFTAIYRSQALNRPVSFPLSEESP